MAGNFLCYGDNLRILREHIPTESVDLVYLDPPFNSNADYSHLFSEPSGGVSEAQQEAFKDTWRWTDETNAVFDDLRKGTDPIHVVLRSMFAMLGKNDMMAYLVMMAPRLVELRRVLKSTGSLYLHCDPSASHYLKILLDAIFGPENFLNEVIWKRTSAHSSAKRYGPIHDVILFYSKTGEHTWNPTYQPLPQETLDDWYNNVEEGTGRIFNRADLTAAGTRTGPSGEPWRGKDPTSRGRHWAIPRFVGGIVEGLGTQEALDALDTAGRIFWPKNPDGIPMLKRYLDESKGVPTGDVITDITPLKNTSAERLGYPTQKPESLLERFIMSSSNKGDTVLDPFCGCGTAIAASQRLNRRWIGIDITHLAITLIKERLDKAFTAGTVEYHVVGEPADLAGAQTLAAIPDKYQFQWWVVGKIGGKVIRMKGGDRGVDGRLDFYDPPDSYDPKQIVISVKAGATGPAHVRELSGTIKHQDAAMGVLVTLNKPTSAMLTAAGDEGFYESAYWSEKYPKLQILSVEEIMAGKRIAYPKSAKNVTLKAAPKSKGPRIKNPDLI